MELLTLFLTMARLLTSNGNTMSGYTLGQFSVDIADKYSFIEFLGMELSASRRVSRTVFDYDY